MNQFQTKSPLRLIMLTYGAWDHASSRERAVKYKPLLEATSAYHIWWIARVPEQPKNWIAKLAFPFIKRWLAIKRIALLIFLKWDIVFIQRLFLPGWQLKLMRKRRIPIIFDFDDAIYLNVPGQPRNQKRTARMIQASSQVIVSSSELMSFCHGNDSDPVVIPTPVDTDRFKPRSNNADQIFTIGWIGSFWTTKYLYEIKDALATVAKLRTMRLLLIGADPRFSLTGIPIVIKSWSYEKEPELLQQMTVGIMPLTDDEWAQGKGGYKLLLYMATGLPVVASPMGVNQEIVQHGKTGFLANNQDEWVKYLIQLSDDPKLCRKMGMAGREVVMKQYSREVCFKKLQICLKNLKKY
jgi:glycosyltransferase involved in cell wall biosynthesis